MKSFLNIVYGIFIGLLAAGFIFLATSCPKGESVSLLPTSTPGELTVYVSGVVATPGVFILPANSRVDYAILAAGGFVAGAEKDLINLAAPLADGQQIDVPGIISTNHINAGRVNINNASVSELGALTGIELTTAQAIIDFRLQNGPFQFIQDNQNVPGVGSATYNGIKDFITIGP